MTTPFFDVVGGAVSDLARRIVLYWVSRMANEPDDTYASIEAGEHADMLKMAETSKQFLSDRGLLERELQTQQRIQRHAEALL
ncbi:MAG: hypothetical protein B7Z42_14070 [Brevundimonas sp. 12-68-7]|nr:MAG: hypothetical protein B7Z42_14070 [Brevundimonas sp. 12-68-7]